MTISNFMTFIWALVAGYYCTTGIISIIRYWVQFFKGRKRYHAVKPTGSVSLDMDIYGIEPVFEYHFKRNFRVKICGERELSNISEAEEAFIDKTIKEIKKEQLIKTFDEVEIIEETNNNQKQITDKNEQK